MARPRILDISPEEFEQRANAYFAAVEAGDIKRVGWAHFASYCGVDAGQLRRMVDASDNETYNLYKSTAKKALGKLRGLIETMDSFAGGNSSKSIFLLKQDFDGNAYTDKVDNNSAPINIKIDFGGTKSDFR